MGGYLAKILLLVVEDEMTLAQMYSDKLVGAGFEVEVAHNGREAFDKMLSTRPSLVLMDILMPDSDGLEALSRAKRDSEIHKIPIVVLTNVSDSNFERRAKQEGASAYLVKAETTPKDIVTLVKNILKLPPAASK